MLEYSTLRTQTDLARTSSWFESVAAEDCLRLSEAAVADRLGELRPEASGFRVVESPSSKKSRLN